MKRGHALKAMTMMLGLCAVAFTTWWAWDRADPVVEFERAKPKLGPPPVRKFAPWKGKAPLPKAPPPPDTQQSPQTETRPRLQAPLRLYFRP